MRREGRLPRSATGLVVITLCAVSPVLAQAVRPQVRARRFAQPPTIDGEVAAESAWQAADVVTVFTQVRPFEGQPATERTEVRVGFDAKTLYIAVVCFDSEPGALAVSDSRRDPELEGEDSFRVLLDTFHDGQNAFIFGTNLAGAQYDAQVTNQGRDGTPSGAGGPSRGGSANLDWDTSWTVRTKRSEIGWSAEIAIPFRSLRYGDSDTWGLNVERTVRRKSETSFWAPISSEFDLYRVSLAGTLTGIETPRQRSLQIVPYALAETRDNGVDDREDEIDGGFDLKYSITSSLTLDLTVNTDFAQVEVDDQQINLDRFSLFFPEKRPFFLENAGYFRVGTTGPRFPGSGFVDLFFSRRIGLDENGVVPIVGGLRVSGKAAGLNVGFLNMQTDDFEGLAGENFTVGRLSREFGNRGRAGLILTNRVATGDLATDDDENQTFGVDGQIGLGRFQDLSAFVAKTDTPGLDGHDHSLALEWRQESPRWRNRASYSEVGEDFNPEIGFVNRSNYRRFTGSFGRRFPLAHPKIKEWGPRLFYDNYHDFEGFKETGRYSGGGELELRNGARVQLYVGEALEGLREDFEIYPGVIIPAGTHRTEKPYYFLFFNSNRGRAVSLGGRVQGGGFFNGEQLSINPTLNLRIGDFLSSEIGWSYNDVDLPGGQFTTNLGRLRLTYAFSTQILLQALIQYNDVNRDVSTNLRFSWLGPANTGLFFVYNEVSEFGYDAAPRPDRHVILKYSHLFDVFR